MTTTLRDALNLILILFFMLWCAPAPAQELAQVATGSSGLWPLVFIAVVALIGGALYLWHRRNPSGAFFRAAATVQADLAGIAHKAADGLAAAHRTIAAQTAVIAKQSDVLASPPVQAAVNAQTAPPAAQAGPGAAIATSPLSSPAPAEWPKHIVDFDGGQYDAKDAADLAAHMLNVARTQQIIAANAGAPGLPAYADGAQIPQPTQSNLIAYYQPGGGGYVPGMIPIADQVTQFNALADDWGRWTWFNKVQGNSGSPVGSPFGCHFLYNYLAVVFNFATVVGRIQLAEQQNPSRNWTFDPKAQGYGWPF